MTSSGPPTMFDDEFLNKALYYCPGYIMYIGKCLNKKGEAILKELGYDWARTVDAESRTVGPGDHPFLIVKTFGLKDEWVLGCICSSTYWSNKCVPIRDNKNKASCDQCRNFEWTSAFLNARPLEMQPHGHMDKHSHVALGTFRVLETNLLTPFGGDPIAHQMDVESMEWIMDNFSEAIKKAEKDIPPWLLYTKKDIFTQSAPPRITPRRRDPPPAVSLLMASPTLSTAETVISSSSSDTLVGSTTSSDNDADVSKARKKTYLEVLQLQIPTSDVATSSKKPKARTPNPHGSSQGQKDREGKRGNKKWRRLSLS